MLSIWERPNFKSTLILLGYQLLLTWNSWYCSPNDLVRCLTAVGSVIADFLQHFVPLPVGLQRARGEQRSLSVLGRRAEGAR